MEAIYSGNPGRFHISFTIYICKMTIHPNSSVYVPARFSVDLYMTLVEHSQVPSMSVTKEEACVSIEFD